MNNTQSLAGASRDVINADNGFHNCIQVVYWMGKSHIYCAKTIVFGKLIMIDYLKKTHLHIVFWDHLGRCIQSVRSFWSGKF